MSTLNDIIDRIEVTRAQWSRIGERWPQGPVKDPTNATIELEAYLSLAHTVEVAMSLDLASAHKYLRQLHYSRYQRHTLRRQRGLRLDALVARGSSVPPTWSSDPGGVSTDTLDLLTTAAYLAVPLVTPAVSVDLGALFSTTEATLFGPSELGLAAEQATGVPLIGITTWVGDLAVWFLAWNRARVDAERMNQVWSQTESDHQLNGFQQAIVPYEMMVGNIDGQVISTYFEQAVESMLDNVPSIISLFERYYKGTTPAVDFELDVTQRFANFIRRAEPPIPHSNIGDTIQIDIVAAQKAVETYITTVAIFFMYQSRRDRLFAEAVGAARGLPPQPIYYVTPEVTSQAATVGIIAFRFIELLQLGLQDQLPSSWQRIS